LSEVFVCHDCGESKPRSEFYVSIKRRCKACHCVRMREHRRANPTVQEYDRLRAKTPGRREYARRVSDSWRAKFPEKYKAHNRLNNSLRDGKIKKLPCAVCGDPRVHAHHHDYSKPLDVVWLCALHHHRGHADGF
jgi:hypothetical protein